MYYMHFYFHRYMRAMHWGKTILKQIKTYSGLAQIIQLVSNTSLGISVLIHWFTKWIMSESKYFWITSKSNFENIAPYLNII